MMWSMPPELDWINRTRNGTSRAYMPLFQTGKKTIELHAEFVEIMIYVYKQRFDQHYVLFSSFLNKYLVRKMWDITFWASLIRMNYVRMHVCFPYLVDVQHYCMFKNIRLLALIFLKSNHFGKTVG